MPKKATPATRLTAADMSPKATTPKHTKGLVLKGKAQKLKPVTLLADGTPDLPHPRGLKKSPVRSLTPAQMEKEQRERGGVTAKTTRSRKKR